MRIAVIGAGIAGLCSVRQLKKSIPEAEVIGFDINKDIGGNWLYTDLSDSDEFGIPTQSSAYKHLVTNLPKHVMAVSDFPIPESCNTFLKHDEFLKYIHDYAKNFDIKKYFKLQHLVTLIKPSDKKWQISYKNLQSTKEHIEVFDYVFICIGRHSLPNIPKYKGVDIFKGRQIHSHNYRKIDSYKDKNVLVVGSGSSAMQISVEIVKVAKNVYLSHRSKLPILGDFPNNYFLKPNLKELTENAATFIDGTSHEIDEILYCTGYLFNFPFLHPDCGIKIETEVIRSLYRQVVNIENPSMFFIGLPLVCCAIPMRDFQARYAVAIINKKFDLPIKEKMIEHMENEYKVTAFQKGHNLTHVLDKYEPTYYAEMAEESGIIRMPPVFHLIRIATVINRRNVYTYRNYEYNIIDDEHFTMKYITS